MSRPAVGAAEEAGGTAGPSCRSRSKPEALPRPWRPLCRATATCSVRPAPSLLSAVSSTGKQHGFTLRPVLPAASGPHQVLIPVQPQVRLQVNCLKNRRPPPSPGCGPCSGRGLASNTAAASSFLRPAFHPCPSFNTCPETYGHQAPSAQQGTARQDTVPPELCLGRLQAIIKHCAWQRGGGVGDAEKKLPTRPE